MPQEQSDLEKALRRSLAEQQPARRKAPIKTRSLKAVKVRTAVPEKPKPDQPEPEQVTEKVREKVKEKVKEKVTEKAKEKVKEKVKVLTKASNVSSKPTSPEDTFAVASLSAGDTVCVDWDGLCDGVVVSKCKSPGWYRVRFQNESHVYTIKLGGKGGMQWYHQASNKIPARRPPSQRNKSKACPTIGFTSVRAQS